jgi:hypothetical protein
MILADQEIYIGWGNAFSNLLEIPERLLPICVSCANDTVGDEPLNAAIILTMSYKNDEHGRSRSRLLLQGLELVRASILKLLADESCKESQCWIGPNSFQVLRPFSGVPEDLAPENYYRYEETRILEAITRYKSVTIISLCDKGNGWIRKFGCTVLCLNDNWSARKIAWQLLELWRDQPNNLSETSMISRSANGFDWLVTKVDELHFDQNNQSFGADDILDSRREQHYDHCEWPRNILDTRNASFQEHFLRSICIFLAWGFLFLGTLSIVTKESGAIQRFRIRRLHNRSSDNLSFTSILDELLFRIPEIEKAWSVWLDFFEEKWSRWEPHENFDYSLTGSSNGFHLHTTPTRRKRVTKKRH